MGPWPIGPGASSHRNVPGFVDKPIEDEPIAAGARAIQGSSDTRNAAWEEETPSDRRYLLGPPLLEGYEPLSDIAIYG